MLNAAATLRAHLKVCGDWLLITKRNESVFMLRTQETDNSVPLLHHSSLGRSRWSEVKCRGLHSPLCNIKHQLRLQLPVSYPEAGERRWRTQRKYYQNHVTFQTRLTRAMRRWCFQPRRDSNCHRCCRWDSKDLRLACRMAGRSAKTKRAKHTTRTTLPRRPNGNTQATARAFNLWCEWCVCMIEREGLCICACVRAP
jgi:hypothetical protein